MSTSHLPAIEGKQRGWNTRSDRSPTIARTDYSDVLVTRIIVHDCRYTAHTIQRISLSAARQQARREKCSPYNDNTD